MSQHCVHVHVHVFYFLLLDLALKIYLCFSVFLAHDYQHFFKLHSVWKQMESHFVGIPQQILIVIITVYFYMVVLMRS